MHSIMPIHKKLFVIGYLNDHFHYVVALDLAHRQMVDYAVDMLKSIRQLHILEGNPDQ